MRATASISRTFTSKSLSCEIRTSVAALVGIIIADPSIATLLLYHCYCVLRPTESLCSRKYCKTFETHPRPIRILPTTSQLTTRKNPTAEPGTSCSVLVVCIEFMPIHKNPIDFQKDGNLVLLWLLVGASLDFMREIVGSDISLMMCKA